MKKSRPFYYSTLILVLLFCLFFVIRNVGFKPPQSPSDLAKIVLGTDWFAQAEHGGFYQSIIDGTYKKYGLDVQIKMGGPQVNGINLLLAKEVDFFIPPSFVMIEAAQKKLPLVSVAAVFQKDLQILMAHPDAHNNSFEDLKNKPIFISPTTAASIWSFLVGKFGYIEDQKKPYSNSLTPFLKDKNAIQEGLLTSEPFIIEKQAHFKPVSLWIANAGFSGYGELITCHKDFEQKNPTLVKNFVKASMEGWQHYLENPTQANIQIKKDNPEMKDDLLAYGVKILKEEKIIEGGDAQTLGLGAMTDKRWEDFFNILKKSHAIEGDIDYKNIYSLKYFGN